MPETLFGLMCFSGFMLFSSHVLNEVLLHIITNNENTQQHCHSTPERGKKYRRTSSH